MPFSSRLHWFSFVLCIKFKMAAFLFFSFLFIVSGKLGIILERLGFFFDLEYIYLFLLIDTDFMAIIEFIV